MRIGMLLGLMVACEPVAPSGNPLAATPVAGYGSPPAAPALADAKTPAPEADMAAEQAEEDALFTLSSEELSGSANAEVEAVEAAPVPAPTPKTLPEVVEVQAPPPPVPTQGWPGSPGMRWPVRLVTTLPHASPPRAIIGLPDGREIVVNPGSMVPDLGLVVVAIAPGTAELARVAAAGDHATIESITLTAQY